ncbi:MAG: SigB/SigF/SigG family RNA polymerase sigma factor [Armatimonadetes bacterium]|nr:SigB/SigF/SigG family RNA polymerase sigma factor [Armatimonadota bacterium]
MAPRAKQKADERDALHGLFLEYWRTPNPALRERLVLAHADLAASLARKFAYRGEPLEDLIQVAQLGLLNAVDRFDPTRGTEFAHYATATIVGEIKRHFRDKLWTIRVPRRLRELNSALMRATERLSQRLGRSPTVPEIAEEAGVSFEDVVQVFELGGAYSPASLEASPLANFLGDEDPELARLEDRRAIEDALRLLPERERTVLRLRYYEDLSQAEIAKRLGISQMHVSRIQREALRRLRTVLES